MARATLRIALFSVFVGLASAAAPGARAQTREPAQDCTAPQPPEAGLMRRLTLWIGSRTVYDISRTLEVPPAISFCQSGEIISYEGEGLLVDPDLRAAYDARARVIFLVQPWDGGETRAQSVLLHELVHDVQSLNAIFPCPQAMEWEAYQIQAAWLEEQGVAHGFNWFSIYLLSRCPGDHHP